MKKGKWVVLLVLLLGALVFIGCGSKEEQNPPADQQQQTQNPPAKEEPKAEAPKAEEPKAEAPKAEEPKAEAPKAEAPKAEAPKAEAPKAEAPKAEAPKAEAPKASPPTLNLGHDLSATYAGNCKTCHAGAAMLDPKPPHNIDASTPLCDTCHKLNPKA